MDEKHGSSCWADKFPIVCIFPPSWSSCEWVGVDFGATYEPPLSPVFACLHYDTSLPLSVSAPTHQGGDSHHLPPGKWQSAEPSPKKGSIASANLLVVHYLLLFIVMIHATHVLYSRNGKWRDFRQDLGRMIMCIRIYIQGDWMKPTRIVWPEFFPCWPASVQ